MLPKKKAGRPSKKKKTAAERSKQWRNPENEELAKERKEKNRKRMQIQR